MLVWLLPAVTGLPVYTGDYQVRLGAWERERLPEPQEREDNVVGASVVGCGGAPRLHRGLPGYTRSLGERESTRAERTMLLVWLLSAVAGLPVYTGDVQVTLGAWDRKRERDVVGVAIAGFERER